MLHQTRGIVLHTLPYSDTSLIAKIYTEEFGLQSYILSGARSRRGKSKGNLLQPLMLLDLVVMHKERNSLQRITDIHCRTPYHHLHEDMLKTSIALFLAEMLYKSIREEESNPALFSFLHGSLQILDLQHEGVQNFHLCFLIQLSKYLGFYPQDENPTEAAYFDLQEGLYKSAEPHHPYFLGPDESRLFTKLTGMAYTTLGTVSFTNADRRILLEKIILFYALHLQGVKDVKSHKVLETVLA